MKFEEIIVTKHAEGRCKEVGVNPEKIKFLLLGAKRQRENIFREIYKFMNYGEKQFGTSYYYRKGTSKYPPLLFTVAIRNEKYIVITITKRKL